MELNEEIEYLKKENEKLRLRSVKKETRKQDYNSESSKIINEAKEIKKMYFAEKDTSKNTRFARGLYEDSDSSQEKELSTKYLKEKKTKDSEKDFLNIEDISDNLRRLEKLQEELNKNIH